MVDGYHKSGNALPVPGDPERGYVCQKEENDRGQKLIRNT